MALLVAQPRIAVLIDVENVSSVHAQAIFRKAAELGNASIRRAYGDFVSSPQNWTSEILGLYAVTPRHNPAVTKGFAGTPEIPRLPAKNAADISLAIDAMDLLHGRRVDAFLLVSSDSDFTRLASRLREDGCAVFGMGISSAKPALKAALTSYFYLDNPVPPVEDPLIDAFIRVSRILRAIRDPKTMRANVGLLGHELRKHESIFVESNFSGFGGIAKLLDALSGCERAGNEVWLKADAG